MLKDMNVNAEIVTGGSAVGASNPLPMTEDSKGTTLALYGGAISASVAEADATVIDMREHNAGSLQVVENSGTGSWVFSLYEKDVATGVFTPALVAAGTARTFAIPDGGGTIDISDLKANYIKFVPVLTGTSNVTVKFTPTIK